MCDLTFKTPKPSHPNLATGSKDLHPTKVHVFLEMSRISVPGHGCSRDFAGGEFVLPPNCRFSVVGAMAASGPRCTVAR